MGCAFVTATRKCVGVLTFALSAVLAQLVTYPLLGQTTVATGSVVGVVNDPSGAVISGAKVTVTNIATGQVIDLTTNSSL